jgi:OFA family oxalate/formate antiporter-like MFS transporter
LALGIAYFAIVIFAASTMKIPPEGYAPPGFLAPSSTHSVTEDFTLRRALGTWQWYGLWLTLFLNTTAGIAIISQAAPMAQEVAHVSAATAAGLVGIISIANGSGRFLWAWLSDSIGRKSVFITMLLLQSAAFLLLSHASEFASLAILSFIVLLCYGGGFGTMPAFAADYFSAREVGSIYGLMTAWGAAGVVGPALIAHVRQVTGEYQGAMKIMALVTLLSALVPLLLKRPTPRKLSARETISCER